MLERAAGDTLVLRTEVKVAAPIQPPLNSRMSRSSSIMGPAIKLLLSPRVQEQRVGMARILPDKEIRRLIGPVLGNASRDLLNPNGIELCFGSRWWRDYFGRLICLTRKR